MPRVRFRIPGDRREIKYISITELAVGFQTLIEQNVSVTREGLYKRMTNLLGFSRTGDAMEKRFDDTLAFLEMALKSCKGDDLEVINGFISETKALIEDEADPESSNDFGKNIIPKLLHEGEKLWPYRFKGYWRDVGTIESLWDANMDMLSANTLDLFDPDWPINSRNETVPPHYIGENAEVIYSMVTEGSKIDGRVENSVLSSSVAVEKGAKVLYSVLMPGAAVKSGATVQYAIIGENTVISENAVVGAPPDGSDGWSVATCGPDIVIKEGAHIPAGAMVYTGEEDFGND